MAIRCWRAAGADRKGRREARIVRVLAPENQSDSRALFHRCGASALWCRTTAVSASDILIPPEDVMGARMGFVVVVELTQRPTAAISKR